MKNSLRILRGCIFAGAVTSQLIAPNSQAQVVFADNYNNVGGTTSDLNEDLAIRQSGSYVSTNGTVSYLETSAGSSSTRDYQNRLDQLQTNLGGVTTDNARIVAYPNASFGSLLSGTNWGATFDFQMEVFTSGGVPVVTSPLSATEYRFIVDTSTTDLVGFDSGSWDVAVRLNMFSTSATDYFIRPQVVVGGVTTTYADIGFTPLEIVSSGWFAPEVVFDLNINEVNNTLDFRYGSTLVASGVDITGAFNTGTAGTLTDRYTAFSGLKGANAPSTTALQHSVDNFALTVVPEPSTYGLLIGGLALVIAVARRRHLVESAQG